MATPHAPHAPTPHAPGCIICCEPYNRSTRICIECQFCSFAACRLCLQKYLTDPGSVNDPSCMSPDCQMAWPSRFVETALTKTFMTTKYNAHREKVLFDREMSLMPFTQSWILVQKRVHEIDEDIVRCRRSLEAAKARRRSHRPDTIGADDVVMSCPVGDCKGFVTQSQHCCGLCDAIVCRMCREVDRDGHVCDEDTVATVGLMKTDTKPCPGCASMIFKIDGCDQMWCVGCRATFSWRTGELVDTSRHRIHNPHFFEMLRQKGDGMIPRDAGIPDLDQRAHYPDLHYMDFNLFMPHSSVRGAIIMSAKSHLSNTVRRLTLLETFIDRNFPRDPGLEPELRNMDIRIKLLQGTTNEKQFTALLRNREVKFARIKDCRESAACFIQDTKVLFHEHIHERTTSDDVSVLFENLHLARDSFNARMRVHKEHTKVKTMFVGSEWDTHMI